MRRKSRQWASDEESQWDGGELGPALEPAGGDARRYVSPPPDRQPSGSPPPDRQPSFSPPPDRQPSCSPLSNEFVGDAAERVDEDMPPAVGDAPSDVGDAALAEGGEGTQRKKRGNGKGKGKKKSKRRKARCTHHNPHLDAVARPSSVTAAATASGSGLGWQYLRR